MTAGFTILADDLDHPEGVTWAPDGHLYAGGEAGQVWRVSLDGTVERVADSGGGMLGVTAGGDGRLYVCDEGREEVVRVDPARGTVETYSRGTPDEPMVLPNASAFDRAGNLYVTDSGNAKEDDGKVYRVAPGGDTSVWTRQAPRYPNGCCLAEGGDALLVVESYLPGVTRFPILPDGSAGDPEVVVRLPEGTVPDGIALDAGGSVYVTCYRPDRIYRVDPAGGVEVFADDPEALLLSAPTNVVFAGPELDRIVVACVGESFLAVTGAGTPGAPLVYPALA